MKPAWSLLAVALLLAGCASPLARDGPAPAGPLDASPQDASSIAVAPPMGPAQDGVGAIHGTVRDGHGRPIEGARASLVSLAVAGTSDERGEFVLDGIDAGPYVLRVQKAGFLPAATTLQVAGEGRTTVEVVLAPDAGPAQAVDFWLGRDRVQVMEGAFRGRDNPLAGGCLPMGPGDKVRWDGPPELRFDDAHQLVWPGTAAIEAVLDWSPASYDGSDMMLVWKSHPDAGWRASDLTPKGKTIRVPVAPEEADGPHQRFTAWQFAVCTKDHSGDPAQRLKRLDGVVHASMHLVRGHPLPLQEPAPDLWGNATRILLVDETKRFTATDPLADFYFAAGPCNGQTTRATRAPDVHESADLQPLLDHPWRFDLFEGLLVPPGTARIEAQLTWSQGLIATAASPLALSFRGADVGPWERDDPAWEHKPLPATEGPGSRTYAFALDGNLTDGAEDVRTAWRFYWNMEGPRACNELQVRLVAEAVRDT